MTQQAIPVEPSILCERCLSEPSVHTHHRNRDRQNNEPENLARLCAMCHLWVHDQVEEAYLTGWLVHSWDDPATVERVPRPRHDHRRVEAGQMCPVCHRKVPVPKEKQPAPRHRATVSMKVPADERENGAALWDERIEMGRELLCPVMGWDDDVPAYYVAMALVDKGLEASREDVRQMADA